MKVSRFLVREEYVNRGEKRVGVNYVQVFGEAGEGGMLTQQLLRVQGQGRKHIHIRPTLRQTARDLREGVRPFARRVLKMVRNTDEDVQAL